MANIPSLIRSLLHDAKLILCVIVFLLISCKENYKSDLDFKLIRAEVKNWDVTIAPSKSPLLSYYVEVSNNSNFTLVPDCIDYVTMECSDGNTLEKLRVYSSHDNIKHGEKDTLMFYKELIDAKLTQEKIESYVKRPYILRISTNECNFIEYSGHDVVSSNNKTDTFNLNKIIIKKKLFYYQRIE
jgi:hypothetical protein